MFIKSEHNGEERRKNGGKIRINLSPMDWLKIGTTVCILMAGGFGFYYNTTWGMQAIAEDIKEVKEDNIIGEKVDKRQDESLVSIQGDIKYIKKDLQVVKKIQEESQKILYKILGAMEGR